MLMMMYDAAITITVMKIVAVDTAAAAAAVVTAVVVVVIPEIVVVRRTPVADSSATMLKYRKLLGPRVVLMMNTDGDSLYDVVTQMINDNDVGPSCCNSLLQPFGDSLSLVFQGLKRFRRSRCFLALSLVPSY